jgi:hypothetical protein
MLHVKHYSKYTKEDWAELSGLDWCFLLEFQPQFSIHCDWAKLSGWDSAYLLKEQPQFSIYCDWEKFDEDDWCYLLGDQFYFNPIKECFT